MLKKMSLLLTVLTFLVVLTACGSSLSKDLQSKTWTLSSEVDDGFASKAKFSDDTMKLDSYGTSEVYTYEIQKDGNKNFIVFTPENLKSDGTLKYQIEKNKDRYVLNPQNEASKDWFGDAKLIP